MTYMTREVLSQEIAKMGKILIFHVITGQIMKNGITLAYITFTTRLLLVIC
jgi:hypothetical protein